MKTDFSAMDIGPFIALIISAIVIVFVVDRISKAGGGGVAAMELGSIIQDQADKLNASRRKRQEDMQRVLLRRIKILGLVSIISFFMGFASLFYLIGGLAELYETDHGGINLALSGLVLGFVLGFVYLLQFINNKRSYEMYYGSIFDKNK